MTAAAVAQAPPEVVPAPWQPVDLSAVLSGSYRPAAPTVGRRSDGVGVCYPGKSHTAISETEGGKTWFALTVALDELTAGNHVVYVDFEDDEGGVVGRLLALNASPEVVRSRFHYLRPDAPLKGGHAHDLEALLGDVRPTLAVLDGITEGMALHGLDPNKNQDAAMFGAVVTKRLTNAGAAALSLDHVVKDRENRGRYALGAVHKLNGLSGAQYVLTNRHPFGVGLTGRSTIAIAKDRPGQLRAQALPSAGGLHWFADLVLTSHEQDFAEVSLEPPHERNEDFRPTVLMQRISEFLDSRGTPTAARVIEVGVTGKSASIRAAINYLILDGYLSEKSPHALIRPYEEGSE